MENESNPTQSSLQVRQGPEQLSRKQRGKRQRGTDATLDDQVQPQPERLVKKRRSKPNQLHDIQPSSEAEVLQQLFSLPSSSQARLPSEYVDDASLNQPT